MFGKMMGKMVKKAAAPVMAAAKKQGVAVPKAGVIGKAVSAAKKSGVAVPQKAGVMGMGMGKALSMAKKSGVAVPQKTAVATAAAKKPMPASAKLPAGKQIISAAKKAAKRGVMR